jgi:3-oxoacyl-[acyl-carrier-protein] synthase II
MGQRVVITGLGIVSGCGLGIEPLWLALLEGRSAIGPVTRFDAGGFASRCAAQVPADLGAKDFVPKSYRKAVKLMARDTELAVIAAAQAVTDAGITLREYTPEPAATPIGSTTYAPERVGCHIGAGLIPAEVPELAAAFITARDPDATPEDLEHRNGFSLRSWGAITPANGPAPRVIGGMNNLPPLWMLKYLPNMLACHVTILYGAEGPSNTITCSEASGILSLGESSRIIERGAADMCFTGGAESKVNPMGLLRSHLADRLAATGEIHDPAQAWRLIRPYDTGATGTLQGEGGGILIVENIDTARARSARIYATVSGFGAAHAPRLPGLPPRAPREGDRNAWALAAQAALRDAGITADEIDAVIPQALGTRESDDYEAAGLAEVFGARLSSLPLVTLTPVVGDCAAGHGGIAIAVGCKMLSEQTIPARLHDGSPAAPLQAGAAPSRAADLRHIMVCTGSLAGQYAAAVISRAP